ncbi:MAG: InlB B-repeat-containing protein [Lachnospiraceae bacterium]
METVLRAWRPFGSEEFLRRAIFRSLTIAGFLLILGIAAHNYSEAYRIKHQEEETALSSVRMEGVKDGFGEIFKEKIFPETGAAGLLSGMRAKPDISGKVEDTKAAAIVPPAGRGTAGEPLPLPEQMTAQTEEMEMIVTDEKIPAAMRVILYGSGGIPEIWESVYDPASFSTDMLFVPEREGMIFDGWYMDKECHVPFEKTETLPETLVLYAGWKENMKPAEDEKGFLIDERGYIIGCNAKAETVIDGLLCVPSYSECKGIEKGAFDAIKDLVCDIYISDNITYIAPGAFDNLEYLMYIEVHPGNTSYYSVNGILYNMDHTVAARPGMRLP